jgi:hypothetical protein
LLCVVPNDGSFPDSVKDSWLTDLASRTDISPEPQNGLFRSFVGGFTVETLRKWYYIYSQKEGFCNDCPACGGSWVYAKDWTTNSGPGNWHIASAGWFADDGGGYWGYGTAGSTRSMYLYLQWAELRQIDRIDIHFVAAGGSIVPPIEQGPTVPYETHNAQARDLGEGSFGTRYVDFTANGVVPSGTISKPALGWSNCKYLAIRISGSTLGALILKSITIYGSGGSTPTFS